MFCFIQAEKSLLSLSRVCVCFYIGGPLIKPGSDPNGADDIQVSYLSYLDVCFEPVKMIE